MIRRGLEGIALAALLVAAPGCGPIALAHDKILGPVSPAGRIHPLAVGSEFRLSRAGPTADLGNAHPFRLYPENPLRHVFAVPRVLMQGMHFYLGFLFRFVGQYQEDVGVPPDEAGLTALAEAPERPDEGEVLRRLGPPRRWIKRAEGSLMVYGADVLRELNVSLGVPPGVGSLIPIPGVAELLRFDYSTLTKSQPTAILFFDREQKLVDVVRSTRGPAEEVE